MRYILMRLLIAIPMLLGISVVSYAIMELAPGDAASAYVDPEMMNQDPEMVERVREQLGLNQPVHVRYLAWLGQALQGNFGYSYMSRQPVLEEIAARIVPTLTLSLLSQTIAIVLGITLGIYCAKNQYRFSDYLLNFFSLLGMSAPNFWFAMMLILLFTLTLGWLPSVGLSTVGLTGPWYVLLWDRITHLIMPVTALALSSVGPWLRYQRASYLDVMNQDYIRTARSKGLNEQKITSRHAFKNAAIPIVTMIGSTLPGLIGGAMVIENIFGLPGLGSFGVRAVLQRDYPSVMAVTFFSSVLIVVGILISDLLYAVIDPRIKLR